MHRLSRRQSPQEVCRMPRRFFQARYAFEGQPSSGHHLGRPQYKLGEPRRYRPGVLSLRREVNAEREEAPPLARLL